jgi:hypothetical protein
LSVQTKNQYSYTILDNGISSFRHSYSNSVDRLNQHYLSEPSSHSLTDPNYIQNHGLKKTYKTPPPEGQEEEAKSDDITTEENENENENKENG